MKIFFYLGWFVGIFPVNFDRNFKLFRFKLCSLTSFFSLVRSSILLGILVAPVFVIPDEGNSYNARNSTNETNTFFVDDVSNIMDIVRSLLYSAVFILPFSFGHVMANPFSKLVHLYSLDDADTFGGKRFYLKTVFLMSTHFFLFICGKGFVKAFDCTSCVLISPKGIYVFLFRIISSSTFRAFFIFYEVLFFMSLETLKGDLSWFFEISEFQKNIFEKCDCLCKKIAEFKNAFSIFLFTDLLFLTLFGILR